MISRDVICTILESLAPEIRAVNVLEVWGDLPERKTLSEGKLQPVIVFGLQVEKELLRYMPGCPGENAANEQGVFYLSLPCKEKGLSTIMSKAKEYLIRLPLGPIAYTHPKIILLLRSFKHVCENMKSALRAQANGARMHLKGNPSNALASLGGFNDGLVARLSKEHAAIRFWVGNMEKMELEEIDFFMAEIKRLVREIQIVKGRLLADAIESALECAEAVERMMKILKQAVEKLDHV
jgi:hypothetical protein